LALASHFSAVVTVSGAATLLAGVAGRGIGTLWVALAVLAGQLSVGWSNDWLDAERDAVAQRREKPVVAGVVSASVVRSCALVALVACVPLSFLSGWRAALVHLGAVVLAWAYNLKLKAGWWSPLPYAVAFAVLPAFVTLGLPSHAWPPLSLTVAAAFVGVGAHFLNTVGDTAADTATNVRGMPQRLGPEGSLVVGVAFLAAASVSLASGATSHHLATNIILAVSLVIDGGVIVLTLRQVAQWPWRLTLLSGLSCLALFVVGGHRLVPVH